MRVPPILLSHNQYVLAGVGVIKSVLSTHVQWGLSESLLLGLSVTAMVVAIVVLVGLAIQCCMRPKGYNGVGSGGIPRTGDVQ